MIRTGQCGCGDVQFEVQGEPINSVFCFCTDCQSATASDKFFGVWFKPSQFRLTQGTTHSYTCTGDSGKNLSYHFCPRCSSGIYGDSEHGIVSVAGANLNRPHDIRPRMSIFTGSAADWAVIPQDIPQFEKHAKSSKA